MIKAVIFDLDNTLVDFMGMKRQPRSIDSAALKALERYHWPGNVRELENAIRRALVVAKGPAILPADLPGGVTGRGGAAGPALATLGGEISGADPTALARQLFQWARREPTLKVIPAVERELVVQAPKKTSGNQVHAAKLLGITRATLRKRVEKFQIKRQLDVG